LRSLVDRGVLPKGAEISKEGVATWKGNDFYYALSLDARDGTWALWIGDHRFQALEAAGYGGVKVKVQSAGRDPIDGRLAPEELSSELVEATSFVRDREDLCGILMSPESLVRGSVEAWQMIANLPARLAQALLVSHDLGREDLELRVRKVLDDAPATNVYGKQVAAVESARRWLKEYTKVVGGGASL
jgi:hypothetical protein